MSKSEKREYNVPIFHDWIDAFRRRDIPKMVSLLTDDVNINSIMFQNYKGKDGATKYWQELFTIFPNIGIDIVTVTANAERIVAEIDVRGAQKGKISSSPGLEKKFQVRGAFVYEFSDNMKIKEIRMYYDSDSLKK
ncbi:MAG TPA: nuclear transport factor 2 family protein [Nitrososphaeraceae archaeon]|nr:nuclear transport factor 2 family protein [Nitrososphaeraceae archaeon]